jgi:integrase
VLMKRKYLNQLEIEKVLSHLDSPYNLISKIQVWTGRRPTEVLLMQTPDIDHEHKIIEFTQLKKRHKTVTKPIDCSAFYDELIAYLNNLGGSLWVFPSPRIENKHICIRTYQYKVKKAGEQDNIYVHPHSFRHSFAVQYLEKKINRDKVDAIQAVNELKTLLGHASLDTTMGYLAYVVGRQGLKDLWEDSKPPTTE